MKTRQQFSARHKQPSPPRKLQETRVMTKTNGFVKGYSANTFQGLVRNYNEDRVSIILNISKPETQVNWPKCSYFGIFDGHGGHKCSDFLRDNLHKYIIEDKSFPWNPISALRGGFIKAEKEFMKLALSTNPVEKSGSCAIIVLIVDNRCFVANVGDSRAIVSQNKGATVAALSIDHKPNVEGERNRIEKYGGTVYQSNIINKKGDMITGPYRLIPGKLSVSRAIGDIEAKLQKYSGNPNVLIGDPEIRQFIFDESHDFIMLGCDGIFDKLSNEEISDVIWKTHKKCESENSFLKEAVSGVICEAMAKKSLDNLTVVLILLEGKSVALKPSYSTAKDIVLNKEKIYTHHTEELTKLNRWQRRESSFDINKQNSNNQNTMKVSNEKSHKKLQPNETHKTMKPTMYEGKEREESREKKYGTRESLGVKESVGIDKDGILRSKRRQSESRKMEMMKNQTLTAKLKGLMRY